MVISDGIPVVPRNRKSRNSVPNPSTEEKTTRNTVPWNKNRSKLPLFCSEPFCGREHNSEFRSVKPYRCKFSEFRSEPFRGREHNSEFLSVKQIILLNSWNTVPNHTFILFRKTFPSLRVYFTRSVHSFPLPPSIQVPRRGSVS
jgi:hypothetical protein